MLPEQIVSLFSPGGEESAMPLSYLSFFSNCVSDRFDSGLVWIGDLVDMMIQMFYEVKFLFGLSSSVNRSHSPFNDYLNV